MNAPIDWLLEGESWIEYRTRRDLLGQAESEPQVKRARKAMLADAGVKGLVAELKKWPGTVIASHKSSGQPFHKLTFLADLGLRTTDPGVDAISARILAHRAAEGPFRLPISIPAAYGGSGRDAWAWALCDAPLSLYALNMFGLGDKPAVRAAAAYLAGTRAPQRLAVHGFKGTGRLSGARPQGRSMSLCEPGHAQGPI